MKKTIAALISVTILLTFAACGNNDFAPPAPEPSAADEKIIGYFMELAKIPRQSHHEEKISEFMYEWFTDRGYAAEQDRVGNIIADIPASAGNEAKPLLVLQGHMDMVCVAAEGVSFNPLTDAIKVINDGVTLTADGTTLGADNGIGLAIIMYITDPENKIEHGPLRVIFTVGEELGQTGVNALNPGVVADAKYLINFDSEEIGVLTNSCSGSIMLEITAIPQVTEATRNTALKLNLSGLLGGHAGEEINTGKINAVKAAAYILAGITSRGVEYELASFVGGSAINAIPDKAEAVLVIDAADYEVVGDIVKTKEEEYKAGFSATDGSFTATLERVDMPDAVFVKTQRDGIVTFAAMVIDGVQSMSQKVDGLVESSSNIGVARVTADEVLFSVKPRSCETVLLNNMTLSIETLARVCGFKSEMVSASSPWPIKEDSRLVPLIAGIYKEQTGSDLTVEATHVGFECSEFARYNPELDIVSVGPDITDAHTPQETLRIASVEQLVVLLQEVLLKID